MEDPTTRGQDPLSVLPPELVQMVVSHLAPRDLVSLGHVSSRWRQMALNSSQWRHVELRVAPPGSAKACAVLRCAPVLEHLIVDVEAMTDHQIDALLSGRCKVLRLTCLSAWRPVDGRKLQRLLWHCAQSLALEELTVDCEISGCQDLKQTVLRSIVDLTTAAQGLRHLSLREVSVARPLRQLPGAGTRLERLTVPGSVRTLAFASTLAALIEANGSTLRTLELADVRDWCFQKLVSATLLCRGLTRLSINLPMGPFLWCLLDALPCNVKNIEELEFRMACGADSDVFLQRLAASARRHAALRSFHVAVACRGPEVRAARTAYVAAQLRAALPRTVAVRVSCDALMPGIEPCACLARALAPVDFEEDDNDLLPLVPPLPPLGPAHQVPLPPLLAPLPPLVEPGYVLPPLLALSPPLEALSPPLEMSPPSPPLSPLLLLLPPQQQLTQMTATPSGALLLAVPPLSPPTSPRSSPTPRSLWSWGRVGDGSSPPSSSSRSDSCHWLVTSGGEDDATARPTARESNSSSSNGSSSSNEFPSEGEYDSNGALVSKRRRRRHRHHQGRRFIESDDDDGDGDGGGGAGGGVAGSDAPASQESDLDDWLVSDSSYASSDETYYPPEGTMRDLLAAANKSGSEEQASGSRSGSSMTDSDSDSDRTYYPPDSSEESSETDSYDTDEAWSIEAELGDDSGFVADLSCGRTRSRRSGRDGPQPGGGGGDDDGDDDAGEVHSCSGHEVSNDGDDDDDDDEVHSCSGHEESGRGNRNGLGGETDGSDEETESESGGLGALEDFLTTEDEDETDSRRRRRPHPGRQFICW